WVNLFFPLFMNFQTEQGVFVMIGQSFFPSVYLGVVPLTLALLAVWRVRTPEVKVLGVATLLAVLLAMGEHTPLWGWLRAVLPLGVMRFPVKMLLLAGFTVPLLAAWGIRQLFDHPTVDRATTERSIRNEVGNAIGVLGLVLCLGLVAGFTGDILPESAGVSHAIRSKTLRMLSETLGFALALAIVASRVFYQDRRLDRWTPLLVLIMIPLCGATSLPDLNPTIPASAFQPGLAAAYHESKGALTPAPKLGESRIMLSPQAERLLHTRMVPKFYDDFIGERLALWGNLNLLDGLPKVNGASTLVTWQWNEVENFLYGTTNPAPANLMDFLGVTHTTKAGELMQWERRETAMPLVSAGQRPVPYTTTNRMPPIFDPAWNPREVVFVEHKRGGIYPDYLSTNRVAAKVLTVRIGATSIEAEVESPEESVVVIAQNDYPAWGASLNGNSVPLERANHAFLAIPIRSGKSTIRLYCVDWPFRIGAGISLASVLACLVLWRRASKEG
ncbi:MAG: hypothetical protein EBS05_16215, partial [Proteobacteria bacterium]|nr:hypothetical protein [Pseudomonadota bacterium]